MSSCLSRENSRPFFSKIIICYIITFFVHNSVGWNTSIDSQFESILRGNIKLWKIWMCPKITYTVYPQQFPAFCQWFWAIVKRIFPLVFSNWSAYFSILPKMFIMFSINFIVFSIVFHQLFDLFHYFTIGFKQFPVLFQPFSTIGFNQVSNLFQHFPLVFHQLINIFQHRAKQFKSISV